MDTLRNSEKSDDKTTRLCWKLLNTDKANMNLMMYLKSSVMNIKTFLHKNAIERVSMVKPFLENNKLITLDKMVLTCLTKLLPTRIESAFIIEYFLTRLKPTTLTTRENLAKEKLNMLKNVELIKQMSELAKVPELTEQYIENAILDNATKRFKEQIDLKIQSCMKQFMSEQRESWLNRINELNDEKNKYRKLAKQAIRAIKTNRYTKAFYSCLNKKWWPIEAKLSIILKKCFRYGNRFTKKTANMCRRRWNYLNKLINNKIKGIYIEEEEIELKAEEAKKDKTIWHPTIWKKIQEKPNWKEAFEKILLYYQPKIMKIFVEDMPKMHYIQEYHDYLDKKMEEIYSKNINLLATTTEDTKELDDDLEELKNENEEWEEIDEKLAEELIGDINLDDFKT